MNLLIEHAREMLNMPPEWDGYELEAIGGEKTKLLRVVGAVAPIKTRGKNKGSRDWSKLDKTTEKTAYFTPEEHQQWVSDWEKKTGKCSYCCGTGKVFARWNSVTGTEYKPCLKCGSTGHNNKKG
jgi:hypothetical protein